MQSGSQIETLTEPPPSRLANVIGTLIALMTLVLPVAAIAYYSSNPPPSSAPNSGAPSAPDYRQGDSPTGL
jgi:hypothetical protein